MASCCPGGRAAAVDSVRSMTPPRVAVGPHAAPFATDAVVAGGGSVVGIAEHPDALVWLDPMEVKGLADQLAEAPDVRWVQLPFAGVERVLSFGLLDHDRIWTCAKGSYAEPVAEHALTLALAGLRHLPTRLAARSWGTPAGTSLYDQRVTILGGGGITSVLLEQLAPFRVDTTVVRRQAEPVPGAARTVPVTSLRRGALRVAGGLPGAGPHSRDDRDHRCAGAGLDGRDGMVGQRGPGRPRGHRRTGRRPDGAVRSPGRHWT